MRKFVTVGARALIAGALTGAVLTLGAGVAHADPWDPWIPGIPNIGGPGVNVGVPGNPLPPGQVKKWIDDIIPDWGPPKGKGKWR